MKKKEKNRLQELQRRVEERNFDGDDFIQKKIKDEFCSQLMENLSFEKTKKLWVAIKLGLWAEQNILKIESAEEATSIKKRIEAENDTYELYRYLNVEIKGMTEEKFDRLLFENMANHYLKNFCE